jgi:hypothetical protein
MVEIVLPRASVELLCKTAELSLNKVNTASVSSISLRELSEKHFPIRLLKSITDNETLTQFQSVNS